MVSKWFNIGVGIGFIRMVFSGDSSDLAVVLGQATTLGHTGALNSDGQWSAKWIGCPMISLFILSLVYLGRI